MKSATASSRMGEECKKCRKWEEDMYWSHFQVVQFFQVLTAPFHQQLAIPQKFANNLREKLGSSVSLKGPSGATWNVGLTASGDALFLKNGWKEFVDAHILEENDLLIFKYNGDSRFDVLMFDRQNFCEKEASYFIRRCAHTDVASGGKTKMSVTESADGNSQFDFSMPDGQSFCEEKAPHLVKNCADTDVASGVLTKKSVTEGAENESSHEVVSEHSASKNDGAPTPTSGAQANGELQTKESKSTRIRSRGGQWKSNRRPVTEEEKRKAFSMATTALTGNSVMVVMRPTHVSKVFYMSFPNYWARIHLPHRSLDVTLRVEEKTWQVRFHHRGFNGRFKNGLTSGGLTGGWKNFALENFLEEFDVCVFNLAPGEGTTPVLDVSIFRVVEEVVPPSLITPPPSAKRGRKPRKATMKKKSIVDEDGSFQVENV